MTRRNERSTFSSSNQHLYDYRLGKLGLLNNQGKLALLVLIFFFIPLQRTNNYDIPTSSSYQLLQFSSNLWQAFPQTHRLWLCKTAHMYHGLSCFRLFFRVHFGCFALGFFSLGLQVQVLIFLEWCSSL
jgi:hypothetical protein